MDRVQETDRETEALVLQSSPAGGRASILCGHLLALAAAEGGGEAALLVRDTQGVRVLGGGGSAIAAEGAACLMDGQSLGVCTVCLLPVRSGAVEVWLCVRQNAPALEHVRALCELQVDDLLREQPAPQTPEEHITREHATVERMQLRMQRVAETADVAFYRCDFAMRMVTGDARFAGLWGLPPERLAVGVPVDELLEFLHPDDRFIYDDSIEDELRDEGGYELRFRILVPSRFSYQPAQSSTTNHAAQDTPMLRHVLLRGWREDDSRPDGRRSVGLAMDVSSASLTAEALRSSESFTRLLLSSLPDCIHILDCDGCIRFVNEGGVRSMEMDSPIIMHGLPWVDLWRGQPRRRAALAVQSALEGETARFQGYAMTMKGTRRFWDVVVTPVLGEDGDVQRLLAIGRDLTDANQSAERLQLALDAGAIAGTWMWDDSTSRMMGDARLALTLGLDPAWLREGVMPNVIYDAVDPRDRFAVVQAVTAATRRGGKCRFEFRAETPEGQRWFEGNGRCDLGEEGRVARFPGIVFDIDRSKRQALRQAALVELGDQLRALDDTSMMEEVAARIICRELNASGAGYGMVNDDGTGMTVGGIAEAGRPLVGVRMFADYGEFRSALGRGEPVAITDVHTDVLTAGHGARYMAEGIVAFLAIPIFKFGRFVGLMFVCHDVPHVWTDEEIVFTRAVADRTHASMRQARTQQQIRDLNVMLEERILQRTRERDRLWNIAKDLFVIIDRHGYYVAVSPSWEEMQGYRMDELAGLRLDALCHPDDKRTVRDTFARLMEGTPWPAAGLDVRMRRHDGSWRTYNWSCNDEGDAIYAVGRDLTRRNELEEQLRQAQKMEAVGQLTGGLAHDFNNLLAGIGGGLELLGLRIAQGRTDGLGRYITASQEAVRRAASLTHRLLAFSRRQTLDPSPTDMNVLVQGLESLLRGTVGPGIDLVLDLQPDLWRTRVDANQLENAILNLCINARDAMHEQGSTLRVKSANWILGRTRSVETAIPPGDYVVLTVQDEGCGMSPEVVQRAFDPFFTTKPQGAGTGLGLSMIYGFTQQSGGKVEIRSAPGQGTAVSLWLPRYEGQETLRPEPPPLPSAPQPRLLEGLRVLVVDDEEAVRMIVTDMVADLGGIVQGACDGPSAKALVAEGAPPSLLISDIGMPGGMNGRELGEQMLARWPSLKVLFITGYAEQNIIGNQSLAAGCALLVKPFTVETFNRKLALLLNGD
ncbi:PAS domain-containing protein [Gluconobacter sp. Dm-73]|uniref:PAS domain-containing protein n=1 Tax=Gluconobacter sp. Dm-73 TaxID=2799802 RepID=UPI001B8B7D09|nr:PAS domain-containing protein [Gluconobacter sp. Dm-73]MBS1075261.1 PAS domain-containing protein [Gluconobacter sp. Dm-73]